jgi:thermostable 8-oxoguanine DNA glycosylase
LQLTERGARKLLKSLVSSNKFGGRDLTPDFGKNWSSVFLQQAHPLEWDLTPSMQSDRLLLDGDPEQMTEALKTAGAHRFPVARPRYIVTTRAYFRANFDMALRKRLRSFSDPFERRDWLAQEKQIKGLGYKEASHFLRNIGVKGHAILDKHVMRCLAGSWSG